MQRGMERVEKLSALQVSYFFFKSPLMYFVVKVIYSHARSPYFDDLFQINEFKTREREEIKRDNTQMP